MDSFFSWFNFCQRRPPKKRRTRNTPPIPSSPPPPPPPLSISQSDTFIHASTIVDDLEKVLLLNENDSLVEESCDSPVSAVASAKLLRITLLARGITRNERDIRMRYVTVACERLFVILDAMKPVDVTARETRRALLQRLLKAEKMAEDKVQ
jgi:hypothetical protein